MSPDSGKMESDFGLGSEKSKANGYWLPNKTPLSSRDLFVFTRLAELIGFCDVKSNVIGLDQLSLYRPIGFLRYSRCNPASASNVPRATRVKRVTQGSL